MRSNMEFKMTFLSKRFSLPDLDCWAIAMHQATKEEVEELYQTFASRFRDLPYNRYEIATCLNDIFQIEGNLKQVYGDQEKTYLRDVLEDVIVFEEDKDGTIQVSLHEEYLERIENQRHLLQHALPIGTIRYKRTIEQSF